MLFPNCNIVVDNLTKNLAIVMNDGKYYLTNTKHDGRNGTKVYMEFTMNGGMLLQKKSLLALQLGSAQKTKNIILTAISTLIVFLLALMTRSVWMALMLTAGAVFLVSQGRGFCLGKKKVISIVTTVLAGTDLNIIRM